MSKNLDKMIKFLEENSRFERVFNAVIETKLNPDIKFTIKYWCIDNHDKSQGWKSTLIDNSTGDEIGSIVYSYSAGMSAIKNDLLFAHASNLQDYDFENDFKETADIAGLRHETQHAAYMIYTQAEQFLQDNYYNLQINPRFEAAVKLSLAGLFEAYQSCIPENENV